MEESTINLTEVAFEPFVSDERNAELVSANKYGVHELVDESWVTREIPKEDYINYNLAPLEDVFIESEAYNQLNSQYFGYPFVVVK